MRNLTTALVTATVLLTVGMSLVARAQECPPLNVQGDQAFGNPTNQQPGACAVQTRGDLTFPDPSCTPGAVNPSVTVEVLKDPDFHTACIRNKATTEAHKAVAYVWYGINHPANNIGANQVCELDHLVPLELGGADTLDNIWPQCGPDDAPLRDRLFKQKDMVESYLAAMVKADKMDLAGAQHGIATNWSQFLENARKVCRNTQRGFVCKVK